MKKELTQPLMMRRDYGSDDKKKDAMMIKEVPIEDYDTPRPATSEGYEIEDYDSYGYNKGCFMCDR